MLLTRRLLARALLVPAAGSGSGSIGAAFDAAAAAAAANGERAAAAASSASAVLAGVPPSQLPATRLFSSTSSANSNTSPPGQPPSPDPRAPLNLFVCAPDTESDAALARVVAAIARRHRGELRVVGVVGNVCRCRCDADVI